MRFTPAAIAAVALVCASTASYSAEIGFHRSLTASGTPLALNVCTGSGIIDVRGVDGNKVEISAKIHKANWHAFGNVEQMKEIAAKPPIQQTGNAIHVGDSSTCGQTLQNIAIDYEISIPNNSTVVAHSGSGNIHVQGLAGFAHVNTGSGDIVANDIGPDSNLQTGTGTIDIQAAHGALSARTASGNLDLRDSQVSEARLQTISGSITTTMLRGGFRAVTSSGNLTIAGMPTSDWELETSSGNIHFEADASAKFDVDAESGSGKINSTLPGTVPGHASNIVNMPVNGGGAEVKMYSSSGSISLQ